MIGGKRYLFTLERRTEALDGFGQESLTYTDIGTAWGSLEAVGARERFESQQVKAEVSHRITIRHTNLAASITAADRLTLGARTFDIVTPMDKDGRRRELEIVALERP